MAQHSRLGILAALVLTYALAALNCGRAPAPVSVATTAAVASDLPLLQPDDLQYEGAFRVPKGYIGDTHLSHFGYGGYNLVFNPQGDGGKGSVFQTGHIYGMQVAELSIPALVKTTTIAELNTATVLQPMVDTTGGKIQDVLPGNTIYPGGMLVVGDRLLRSFFVYYDGNGSQSASHFWHPLDLKTAGTGPFTLGPTGTRSGMWSGYMTHVPQEWQAALGGDILVGNCCLSVISRTSFGPAAFVANAADVGTNENVPKPLVYYDQAHQTLAETGLIKKYFDGNSTLVKGVAFAPGTRTVLFFGRHGLGKSCYGTGTGDQALVDAQPTLYCFDPVDGNKGGHGYPYVSYVWAYDVNDFIKVRAGTLQPWEVKPYAVWPLTFPWSGGWNDLGGATLDPKTGRIYVAQIGQDRNVYDGFPINHAFTVKQDAPPPPDAKPSIVVQPKVNNLSIAPGVYTVAATGTEPLTYQWQRATATGSFTRIVDGAVYAGTTTATLTVKNPLALARSRFRVVVTNKLGSVTSGNASLTIEVK